MATRRRSAPHVRSAASRWLRRGLYAAGGLTLAGAALVGLELRRASDIDALLRRMDESPLECRRLEPGTPEYDYLT